MNKIFRLFLTSVLMTILSGCTPDTFELNAPNVKSEDLVEGFAFKIEHDKDNPNIINLINLMGPGYTPLWDHPQGRSQDQKVTLRMPFPGTYTVTFGVETQGGIVYGVPATFEIKDFHADFVNDELWTLLSGGVNEEKTWYLDLDENGLSRYFSGALAFYGTEDSWETVTNGVKLPDGSDSWNWSPDWAGNQWLMSAVDFGSMTFNLKGGANVTVDHKSLPSRGTEKGVYMLDAKNHTLRMTNAAPLHDVNRDGQVVDWGNIKIMSLTKNTMQLGVLRDKGLSGEDPALFVYNFISKEYKDNWVAGEPEPPYTGDVNDDLTTIKTKKWKMSLTTPYNWSALDGTLHNDWKSPADYLAAGSAYNEAMVKNTSLSMTKTSDTGGDYVFTDGSGAEIKGVYSTDDKNNINFGKSISFAISGNILLATTADNTLRMINTEKDESGNLSGIWLGQRSPSKDEYMVYHFELVTSADGETKGTEVSVDNSKIVMGDIEDNGNIRIEIYNEYGATKSNPPINTSDIKFSGSVAVTFTLSGITLTPEASGSYATSLYFADADWSAQYPGGGAGDTTIDGNGTYTVWGAPSGPAEGVMVFIIDMKALLKDVVDPAAMKVNIDKIVLK